MGDALDEEPVVVSPLSPVISLGSESDHEDRTHLCFDRYLALNMCTERDAKRLVYMYPHPFCAQVRSVRAGKAPRAISMRMRMALCVDMRTCPGAALVDTSPGMSIPCAVHAVADAGVCSTRAGRARRADIL